MDNNSIDLIKIDNKKNYITILNVLAAISVVILHTNGCFWTFSKERYWYTANIIECVFYFAVPIFFMITGINLIDYQEKYSTKVFFIKRIKKTVVPFLFWSFFGIGYLIKNGALKFESLNLKNVYNGIMNTSYCPIYWFFITIFSIYLCLPLFASVEKNKRIPVFKYLTISYFIFNCLLPLINEFFELKLKLPISIIVCCNSLFWVLVGYILDNIELKRYQRVLFYVFGIGGLLLHIIGTYKLSIAENKIIKTFKGYSNLPSILYSIAVFIFIKQITKNVKHMKVFNFLSKHTFAIYLIHWYFKDLFLRYGPLDNKSIIFRLGLPFVIIPICVFISVVIKKIPILKNIVP